jgi:hypothetical protein
MISQNYLTEIKNKLSNSQIIENIKIIKERAISDQGFFRARLTLKTGDFLEVADLANFPHHLHDGDEFNVKPSESRNILQIITLIEQEINHSF